MSVSKHTAKNVTGQKKLAIVSLCCDDWGGSEELWGMSISHLQKAGARVFVIKDRINRAHPRYIDLASKGVFLEDLDILSRYSHPVRLLLKGWKKIKRIENPLKERFGKFLRTQQPNLVLISQGINFDGLLYADVCLRLNIPYVIVSQKAVEFYWPPPNERTYMTRVLQNAKKCFFVSQQNKDLTEEQFGFRFSNAEIISNPLRIPLQKLDYPTEDQVRLACVGRLFIIDKGQDILLRIMAMQKWRDRPISISFIGSGKDEEPLKALAALLNVTNVEFKGHVQDMQEVWKSHHALVLPSRSEGLPLVVLEAMCAGRTVIATRAGGTQEIIKDGVTGFIGESNLESFESTLEKAWTLRRDWEEMGKKAFDHAVEYIPKSPEIDFAKQLTKILHER